MLTATEEAVIRNVIRRLTCAPRADGTHGESDFVRDALRGPAKPYLDTWVIAPLQLMLSESRDIQLARRLSE